MNANKTNFKSDNFVTFLFIFVLHLECYISIKSPIKMSLTYQFSLNIPKIVDGCSTQTILNVNKLLKIITTACVSFEANRIRLKTQLKL